MPFITPSASMNRLSNRLKKIPSPTLFLLSFVATIGFGTLLLRLPFSTVSGIQSIDALFTATSAVCVTGLTVIDTGTSFTWFGQIVILLLIQIGGLGLMTLTVFFFRLLGMGVSIQHRSIMQETFSAAPRKELISLLKAIFIFTAVTELLGATVLTLYWLEGYSLKQAAYLGLFHAVSAFCNAGFSLFSDNLLPYTNAAVINITIVSLIVLGGIGFPVVYDLYRYARMRRHQRVKLSLQTQAVLITTLALILAGAALFFLFERNITLKPLSLPVAIMASFFQSITARTAGFNTIDMAKIGEPAALLLMILMFIGASPGSCAGGIKTTTISILSAALWCRLRGQYPTRLFRKNIPEDILTKGLSILGLSLFFISIIFFAVLVFQQSVNPIQNGIDETFRVYLFETISAFGTVGLSMGATPVLSSGSKISLVVLMLIGRVGVIGFSYVFAPKIQHATISYSEEPIMIG